MLVGHRLDEELSDLADQLADRLLAPSDFILISWYFLHNWLPLLGPNVAMLLILLQQPVLLQRRNRRNPR